MKNPREILSERHQSAEPKLDALRKSFLAEHLPADLAETARPQRTGAYHPVSMAEKIWLELFVPCRRAWVGFAVVWMVLLGAHFVMTSDSPHTTLAKASTPTPEVLNILKEQKQMMAQLLGPLAAPLPGVPGPRSERREETYAV